MLNDALSAATINRIAAEDNLDRSCKCNDNSVFCCSVSSPAKGLLALGKPSPVHPHKSFIWAWPVERKVGLGKLFWAFGEKKRVALGSVGFRGFAMTFQAPPPAVKGTPKDDEGVAEPIFKGDVGLP